MEWIQRESGKDWIWFSQCFAKGRVFKGENWEIWIGPTPGEKVNGWGILVYSQCMYIGNFIENKLSGDGMRIYTDSKYVGQFVSGWYNGFGTLTYNSGLKYEGEWSKGCFDGLGSITYPDGIQYKGQWNKDEPGSIDYYLFLPMNTVFDALHPMVKECIEQGLCTNTLPIIMPQRTGFGFPYYCETCWIHCQQQSSTELWWNRKGIECRCDNCSWRSKRQKWNELLESR